MPRRIAHKKQRRRTFIREWREHRHLTQAQLAERLEMSEAQLSRVETGNQGYTQDLLEVVADALQIDVASLLMRNPTQPEAIWSIWDQAKPAEREQIIAVAQALKRTGS